MENINSILLIDDDEITNIISKKLLQSFNICENIHSYSNGMDALNFIKDYANEHKGRCPELILLDLSMPLMSGLEFLRSLNKFSFSNKDKVATIVLATGYDIEDVEKAKRFGVEDFLLKPLSREGLEEIFIKYFNKVELKRL